MHPAHVEGRSAEKSRRYVAAAIAVAAALASGCSAKETSTTLDGDTPTTGSNEQTTAWADQLAVHPDGSDDPLVTHDRIDELAFGSTTAILDERDRIAVECMASRGFDIEIQVGPRTAADVADAVDTEPPTRSEFAARWGFGHAAGYGSDGRRDPALIALTQSGDIPEIFPDENGIPTVQFDVGKAVEANGSLDVVNQALYKDDEQPSCQNVANAELELTSSGPFYAANELRQQVSQRIAADSEITQLQTEYEQCMTDAGFPGFDGPSSAFSAMKAALFAFSGDPDSNSAPSAASLTPEQRQHFDELQQRERAMAVANVDCGAAFTPAATSRSDEIQREVLDDNQPLVRIIKPD